MGEIKEKGLSDSPKIFSLWGEGLSSQGAFFSVGGGSSAASDRVKTGGGGSVFDAGFPDGKSERFRAGTGESLLAAMAGRGPGER